MSESETVLTNIQTVKFELPAFHFHLLMQELEYFMLVEIMGLGSNGRHNKENCKELHKMLASQVGTEVIFT